MKEEIVDGEVVEVDKDGQEPVENFRKNGDGEEVVDEDNNGNRYLPGHEVPRNKPIEAAALRYKDVRDERIGLSRDEKKAKDELIALMKRDRVPVYSFDGLEVKLTEKPNVKVIQEKEDEGEPVEVEGEQ